jgi:hypothetical protein
MNYPTQNPSAAGQEGTGALGTAAPHPLTEAEERLTMDGTNAAVPTLAPPGPDEGAGSVAEAVSATTWHSDKRITTLWSLNQNRNSWIGTNDAGWKKLANNSDTAVVALTILAAHARDTNTRVDYREETADNMVHEMYVW